MNVAVKPIYVRVADAPAIGLKPKDADRIASDVWFAGRQRQTTALH